MNDPLPPRDTASAGAPRPGPARRGAADSTAPLSLPLATLLAHTADAVQAVRGGASLNAALAACPAAARPGTQALSFHALRWLGSAQALRTRLAPKPPAPKVDALLLTALALLWPPADAPYAAHTLVDQAVDAARRRAPQSANFINAVLRRFLREREALVGTVLADPVARYNHPAWWIERLQRDWPAQWPAILDADNRHPPMTLRVNARRGDAAAYVARLAAEGIAAVAVGAHAVRLAQPRGVLQLPGFADGDVSVQDAAAQRAAPLLLGLAAAHAFGDAAGGSAERGRARARDGNGGGGGGNGGGDAGRAAIGSDAGCAAIGSDAGDAGHLPAPWRLLPGARVLDACAAPGGKTAHLLELADLDVLALDSDATRLTRVGETLARLGLHARTVAGDAAAPAAWFDGRPFDAILLDAPCSAAGIVRRHPDVRWLRRSSDIAALAALQARLLDALWPLLKPGGRLLFCTCSVFRAEGQDQIDAFLQRQPGARRAAHPPSPGHLLPLPDNAGDDGAPSRAAPEDGFFYALIEKT